MSPEDPVIPPADAYLSATFDTGGYLSQAYSDYRPRPGQVAFARAVDEAIVGRKHLLAEAGTGVGKSYGYSVPATYHANLTQQPVVIVTSNNALSEQLVDKDLPLLQRILPWPFTFALLKGRSNFLCANRFKKFIRERVGERESGSLDATRRQHLTILTQWAHDTCAAGPNEESGDKSELPFEPGFELWKHFSVDAGECKKSRCPDKERCFPNTQQARARKALVIVTNYHMLYAHLMLEATKGASILPRFGVLICDEGHRAAPIARDVGGFRFTQESVRRLARKVNDPFLEAQAERAAGLFFHSMATLRRDRARYKAHLTGDFNTSEMHAWHALHDAALALSGRLTERLKELQELQGLADDPESGQGVGDAEILSERALDLVHHLKAVVNPELDERHVYFLEETDKGSVAVTAKLVHPGDLLRPLLFDRAPRTNEDGEEVDASITVVGTSATLATGDGNFDFIAHELGLQAGEYATLLAESPFDWRSQALFIVPDGMPDPNAPEFRDAVAAQMKAIFRLAGGRTLGLFTSRRMLDFVHDAVFRECRELNLTLIKQGDAPRGQLLQTFKTDITSVLLGTESFWAGVDVPGQALSVVVMDRLPFPSPDDPIAAALGARDDKSFFRYNVPVAIIQFKQGAGRAIRSMVCKAVIVCLDNRLLTKRYRSEFLRALPASIGKTTRLEAITDWLPPAPAPPTLIAPRLLNHESYPLRSLHAPPARVTPGGAAQQMSFDEVPVDDEIPF